MSRFTMTPLVFVVNPSLPVSSVKEFLERTKARPGELTYASAGPGSISQLVGEWIKFDAGIKMLEVPSKGVNAELPDLLGGQVIAAFVVPQVVVASIKAGKLKALAVAAPDVKGQVENTGSSIAGDTPEEFAVFVRAESAKWGKVIRDAGIKPE